MKLAKEILNRYANNPFYEQSILAAVKQEGFTARVLLLKRPEPAQIIGANPAGILDFQCPQAVRTVDHEIHLHAGSCSPEEQLPF